MDSVPLENEKICKSSIQPRDAVINTILSPRKYYGIRKEEEV
jgi:hypothetical protein